MANIKDFIKKIGNSAVSLEEQQQALAQVEKTIIEAKQKREEAVGKNADMVIQALKTIEAKLEAKLVELNNTPAKQGIQGPAGKDGKDGRDGKNGRDGINGRDGKDGKDGIDGQDGVSVIDAKIDFDGSLVIYLSNGNEIDCGQILQPEVARNIIISSGGSGTSQVVTDTLKSLQDQINVLTGIDGTLGTMAQQDDTNVDINGGAIDGTPIGAVTASTGRFTDLTDSGLTSGRVTYAGTGGNLRDASNFTYDGTNLVAGAIQNTPIGATTPSTGAFTTITGQTGRLNGTGQNLLFRSQLIGGTSWDSVGGATASTNAVVAPDGTTTASTLTVASGGYYRQITTSTNTILSGVTYTFSCYVKASVSGGASNIRLTTNNINAWNTGFSTRFALTSSWQRVSVTGTISGTGAYFIIGAIDGTGTGDATCAGNVDVWGAQFELGSTANTYIPTTTAVVYGTPTLSFSGVSEIGLLSNGALYLQPAGTGAIQAQATTSTTAGGNARGANAVDWQTLRTSAGQVASSTYSVIGGGQNNTSGAFAGAVLGGVSNTISGSTGYHFIGSGQSNSAGTGTTGWTSIVGGRSNTAAGWHNFIGGGFTNSGTSGSAVTTQATTTVTSGSTAVTLSGSNASIRVGQYITGTGIAADTYVAAISGTSLTLSQNATASGSPTLSFFTPHGVVVGGGNNQATGSYSFIGGGGDAGTAGNRNVASGDWSFVGGGARNTASGIGSFVGGGGTDGTSALANTASGIGASVIGGASSTASGNYSVTGGRNNIADGNRATSFGTFATTRSLTGNIALSACNIPITNTNGVSQSALLVLARQTTDATPTVLASDANAAGTTNQVILPNNSAYYFKGSVIANVTGAANGAAWSFEGAIMRGANAASTVLIDTPSVNRVAASAGATAWTVAITADTTNGGIAVTVTGAASTTIRWVAKCETTEVTF